METRAPANSEWKHLNVDSLQCLPSILMGSLSEVKAAGNLTELRDIFDTVTKKLVMASDISVLGSHRRCRRKKQSNPSF